MLSRVALLPAAVAVLLLSSSCFGGGDDDGDSLPTNTPDAPLNTPTDEVAGEQTPGSNGTAEASPTPSGPQTHTVQAGEFLSTIAPLYGVTVDEILAANEITDPNVIFPGQELIIPVPGAAGATPGNGADDTTPTAEATSNSG